MADVVLSSRERVWGGGEVFLNDVGHALQAHGHAVRWRVEPDSELARRVAPRAVIRRDRPVRADVVISNDFRSLWQSLLLDGRTDRAFVIHGAWQVSPLRARLANTGRVRSSAVSRQVSAAAEAAGFPRPESVLPLGPACTASQLAGLLRTRPPRLDRPVVGTIARWDPVKRLELFCRSVQAMGCEGLVLAPPPSSPEERSLAERVARFPRVRVVHGENAAFWADCDVFLSTSSAESLGLAHLEALANGRPLLSTAAGGPADFMTGPLAAGALTAERPDAIAAAAWQALQQLTTTWDDCTRQAVAVLRGRGPEPCARALLGAQW